MGKHSNDCPMLGPPRTARERAMCAELEKERDEVWKVLCGIDLGRQPEDMLTESLRSPETRSEFLAEWSRDADTILKGLQEKAKASESRVKALEELLRAQFWFSGWRRLEWKRAKSSDRAWCSDRARVLSKIIPASKRVKNSARAALSDKLPTGITPGQCGCQCHDKVYGCNAPADDHGSCCLGGGKQ